MAPPQLTDPTAQLLLLDVCQLHRAPLGIAVLARQPAGSPLGNPESILQNHHGPLHREVRFAARRRFGLRSFLSQRKVRLTAQQAPEASPYRVLRQQGGA